MLPTPTSTKARVSRKVPQKTYISSHRKIYLPSSHSPISPAGGGSFFSKNGPEEGGHGGHQLCCGQRLQEPIAACSSKLLFDGLFTMCLTSLHLGFEIRTDVDDQNLLSTLLAPPPGHRDLKSGSLISGSTSPVPCLLFSCYKTMQDWIFPFYSHLDAFEVCLRK